MTTKEKVEWEINVEENPEKIKMPQPLEEPRKIPLPEPEPVKVSSQ